MFEEKLVDLIEQHIDDSNFGPDKISQELGMSRSQLHRKIKSATGLSTTHFVRLIRLQKAAEMLKTSNLTISEVAYQIGIGSPQNFSKYFHEQFGVSPSEYRRQGNEQLLPSHTKDRDLLDQNSSYPFVRLRKMQNLVIATLILVIGVLVFVVIMNLSTANKLVKTSVPDPKSLAILPFKHASDRTNSSIAFGIEEEILLHLAKFENIRLVSRTSTEKFANSALTVPEIASQLDARYIVEGSIINKGNRFRVSVQLIDGLSDTRIWSESFDRSSGTLQDLQSEVAIEIAQNLDQEITPVLASELAEKATNIPEAYRAFIRGRHLLRSRLRSDLEEAVLFFDEAIDIDPQYSEAYSGKAEAFHLLENTYGDTAEEKWSRLVEQNALQAISKKPSNAKAYALLASSYRRQHRHKEALLSYEIALEKNPRDALNNYWYALQLRTVGQIQKALKFHVKAAQLDPLHPVISAGHLYTLAMAGKHQNVAELMTRDTTIFKDSFLHLYVAGCNQMYQGDYLSAIPFLEQSIGYNPEWERAQQALAVCHGKLGHSQAVSAFLSSQDTSSGEDALKLAYYYLSLDSLSQGVHFTVKAAENDFYYIDFLADPLIKIHSSQPEILGVLRKFELDGFAQGQSTM